MKNHHQLCPIVLILSELKIDWSKIDYAQQDARDALEMRQSTLWRQGVTESVFRKPSERPAASFSTKFKKKKGKAAQSSPAGSFEQYTRGIGRRLMERQGWKDGLGLGPANAGIYLFNFRINDSNLA